MMTAGTSRSSVPPLAPSPAMHSREVVGSPVVPSNPGADEAPRCTTSQQQLYFPLPITTNIENTVELTNPHDRVVLFKVKTSEVNRYVVRPKVGVVHPRASIKLRFVLLADHAKGVTETCRDRFSVLMRFAGAGENVAEPSECWANPSSLSTSKIHLPCRFSSEALPEGLNSHMERPTNATPGLTPRRAESVGAGLTPRSTAPSPTSGPMDARPQPRVGDPKTSTLAEKRKASASTDRVQGGTMSGSDTLRSGLQLPLPAVGPNTHSPPLAVNKTTQNMTPTSPHPSPALVDDIRVHIGTRKSQFRVLYEKQMPIVMVLPLIILCYCVGAYSEDCMAFVEQAMQYLQVLLRSFTSPIMGKTAGANAA